MTSTYTESTSLPVAAAPYGGLVDAIGGIATIVLAIVALRGVHPETLSSTAVIVFGGTLLMQSGSVLSEYESDMFPVGTATASAEPFGFSALSSVFLVGLAGLVLGTLALLGIAAETLAAVSVIAFGSALLLSSNSPRRLSLRQISSRRSAGPRTGAELLADEMASGSVRVQMLAGLAVIILGVVVLVINQNILRLAALIILGATLILTGSTLTWLATGFMRPMMRSRRTEGGRSTGELAAEEFLESIYRRYLGKSSAGAAGIPLNNAQSVRSYFTSGLASLILENRTATRLGASPAFDSDLFIGRPEWDVSDLSIDVIDMNDIGAPKTVGTVTFMNFGKPERVVLELLRSGKEWRIAEVEWYSGTLSRLYRRKAASDGGAVR